MAQALMTYETIDKLQIDAIMEGREPPPPKDWSGPSGSVPKNGDPSSVAAGVVDAAPSSVQSGSVGGSSSV